MEKKTNDTDSSLPSLEDEKNDETDKTKAKKKIKKKSVKKDEHTKGPKVSFKSFCRV